MISIVIPTYKRLDALQRCVESIVPQISEGMEMIIIDDFSEDMTEQYLIQQMEQHDFIKVNFNDKNYGVNYCRNKGVELASKKYILFIDNDDALGEGSLSKIVYVIKEHPSVKHFLFLVSDRMREFKHIQETKDIYYEEWISGRVYGDFTHVVLTEIMKRYLFFEQFRMFEHLNWLRIKKETSPQLLVPIVTTQRERNRSDSLSVLGRFKTLSNIRAKFDSEKLFYSLYYEDLKIHNPTSLSLKLIETIVLGVASDQKRESIQLIGYANKRYIKWLGKLITLLPTSFVKRVIIKYSKLKVR